MKKMKRRAWIVFVLVLAMLMPCFTIHVKADTRRLRVMTSEIDSICFDAIFYAEQNPDLKKEYGYDETKLYDHWKNFGIAEGRESSPVWFPAYYISNNPDVVGIFGSGYEAAYEHFKKFGHMEGRISSPYYSGTFYRDRYADLKDYDSKGLLMHFKNYGLNEGRMAYNHRYEGKTGWRTSYPVPKDPIDTIKPATPVTPTTVPATIPTVPTTPATKAEEPRLELNLSRISMPADGGPSTRIEVDTHVYFLSYSSEYMQSRSTGGFQVSTNGSSWLTVGRGSTGGSDTLSFSDKGSFYVYAQANPSASSRTGTITVSHSGGKLKKSITVTQEGKKDVQLSVSTKELSVSAEGTLSNARPVQVTTQDTGGFTVEVSSADRSWLSIGKQRTESGTAELTYTGNGTFYVNAAANQTAAERTGRILVTHAASGEVTEYISVVQSAKAPDTTQPGGTDNPTKPTGSTDNPTKPTGGSTDNPTKPTGGSTGNPTRPTGGGSAVPTRPSGGGNAVPTRPSGGNNTVPTRPSSEKEDHTQDPDDSQSPKNMITADVSEITANANGVLSASFVEIDTNGTGGFQADTGNSSWLKIGKSDKKTAAAARLSYDEGGIVYVFADKYTGKSSRTGTIVFQHENGTAKVQVTVTQSASGTAFTIDTERKTAEKDGSFYNNAVSVKTGNTNSYTVEVKDCDWLGITSENTSDFDMGLEKMFFTGSQTFYLVAAENTGSKRSAVITVTQEGGVSKEITVVQIGTDGAYMELDRETAYFDGPEAAVSGIVHVLADEDTKWTAEASEKWIKISDSQELSAKKYASMDGTASGAFYIHVDKNDSFEERDGYVTVSAPGMESSRIYVSQIENERDLAVLLEELAVTVTQKTFKKGKTSKIKFTYPEGLYASDIQKVSYKSSNKKAAAVDKNGKIKALRKGKSVITVKVQLENGASKIFKLKIAVGDRKVKITNKK